MAAAASASPERAERIKRGHELSSEQWILQMKLAESPAARAALTEKRPDARKVATSLWPEISGSLREAWTIPYASYFLNITRGPGQKSFARERQMISRTILANHLRAPGISAFAIALADEGDPKSLSVLEKIIEENPDKMTQGVAALGASLLLQNLGDAPELMQKRLTYLRKAIIQAADEKIGERTVADIASDELYVIRFLVKGRESPELSGTDVGGRNVKLSDSRGRITVLLFWDAKSQETDRIIGLTNKLVEKYRGQSVALLGVTTEDQARIRMLQADGSILWNNIIDPTDELAAKYKISAKPAVFVLDEKGVIQFSGLPGSFVELTVDALLAGGE